MSHSRFARRRTPCKPRRQNAFALVLSLTVMAMLLLLCIGVSALLSIELKVHHAYNARIRAHLNAMMGARIALGEIQRTLGPDRRISANAAVLSGDLGAQSYEVATGIGRPRYVGVWGGLVASGKPAVPPVADYATDHNNAFLGWLASGKVGAMPLTDLSATQNGIAWMKSGAAKPNETIEWLLLDGGTGAYAGAQALTNADPLNLYAMPEPILDSDGSESGSLAWVAMDENQKARVDLRDDTKDGYTLASRSIFRASSARSFFPGYAADGATPGQWRSYLMNGEKLVPSGWTSLPLDPYDVHWFPTDPVSGLPVPQLRHDFTTESLSLLTDTANGGLKRDLSLLTLMSDTDFDAQVAPYQFGGLTGFIGFESGQQLTSGRLAWRRATGAALPYPAGDDAKIWPIWSDVREWARFATTAQASGAAMMGVENNTPYITLIPYTDASQFRSSVAEGSSTPDPNPDRQYQTNWRQPVLCRYRVEIYMTAIASGPTTYNLVPQVNVSAQLWNPYNVRLKFPSGPADYFTVSTPVFPFVFDVKSGTTIAEFFYASGGTVSPDGTRAPILGLGGYIPMFNQPDMEPGEVRTFSWMNPPTANVSPMSQGYNKTRGVVLKGSNIISNLPADASITVQLKQNLKYVYQWSDATYSYCTFFTFRGPSPSDSAWGYQIGKYGDGKDWRAVGGNPGLANNMILLSGTTPIPLPPPQALAANPFPIGTFEMRLKAEKPTGVSVDAFGHPFDTSRAWLGEPPLIHGTLNLRDSSPSLWNPSPMEFVAWDAQSGNAENSNDLAVNGTQGYIGTGYASDTGLTHPVYHHLPLHPPVGLMDLRHARLGGGVRSCFDYKANMSGPGFNDGTAWLIDYHSDVTSVHEAFGNSLSNPFVPGTTVFQPTSASDQPPVPITNTTGGMPNGKLFTAVDMSWVMNAAIADTWFVSSLGEWDQGAAAQLFKDVNMSPSKQLDDLFGGVQRLPNQRLIPNGLKPTTLLNGSVATTTGYKEAASSFLIEGGFNINSTSVRAWRALLASLHQDQPALGSATATQKLSSGSFGAASGGPVAVPVADVVQADLSSNPQVETENRVNGGRALSDSQLDTLAQMMVNEVKKRGPFLSLGEFLNRRLESGALGQKGAGQAAIDAAGLNDYRKSTGHALSNLGTTNTATTTARDYSGVGLPGWLSQADLLAPVANALTARGDTFVIRAAGSSESGGSEESRQYLELTIRRTYDYIDASDAPQTEPDALVKKSNRAFGRRFVVVAIRPIEASSL